MADVRLATGYGELKQASHRLRKVLSFQGILVTHPVMTAINARVLPRPFQGFNCLYFSST